jgi:hypothetical protein
MNNDQEHLRLLSLFHYICAGILAFLACFPVIHLVLGLVLALHPNAFGPGKDQPPAVIGWVLVAFAGSIILFGWTLAAVLALAGRCLARRKSYNFCMIAAAVGCLFMPFGTVLGVFTIIVLARPSVKELFQVSRPLAHA